MVHKLAEAALFLFIQIGVDSNHTNLRLLWLRSINPWHPHYSLDDKGKTVYLASKRYKTGKVADMWVDSHRMNALEVEN